MDKSLTTQNIKIGDQLRASKPKEKKLKDQIFYNTFSIAQEYFDAYLKPYIQTLKLKVSYEYLGAENRDIITKYNPFVYTINRKAFYKICQKHKIFDCALIYPRFFYQLLSMLEDEHFFIWNYSIYVKGTKHYTDVITFAVEEDWREVNNVISEGTIIPLDQKIKLADILRQTKNKEKRFKDQNFYSLNLVTSEYFKLHTKPFLNSLKLTTSRKYLGSPNKESVPRFNTFTYTIDTALLQKICNKFSISNFKLIYKKFFYRLSNLIENENFYILDYNIKEKNSIKNKQIITFAIEEDFYTQINHLLLSKMPNHYYGVLCNGEMPESMIINIDHKAHDRTKNEFKYF